MADLSTAVVLVGAAVVGLAVGSFLNVVVYRLPRGESLSSPPSHCPRCGTHIRNRHNVPVLGWLMLRGRCFDCRAPISARYPLVEAATALLFAAAAWPLAAGHLAYVPAALWAVAAAFTAVLILADRQRPPLRFALIAGAVVVVLLGAALPFG